MKRWTLRLIAIPHRVYLKTKRFVLHFIEVEKRFRSHWDQVRFVFRWLRYALYRLHLLPRWIKLTKLTIFIFIIISPYIIEFVDHRREVSILYDKYYTAFYKTYQSQTTPEKADYYADFYALLYAEYYASNDYQVVKTYALPKPTKENFEYKEEAQPENVPLGLTRDGIELIKHFEGRVLTPYKDVGGKLTIGYGHLITEGEYFTSLTEQQAEDLLVQDVKLAEAIVKRNVHIDLTPNQFSALVSFVYNLGPSHFKRSTLLKKLNRGDIEGASQEFLRWVHVGKRKIRGLERRRRAEQELFLRGV